MEERESKKNVFELLVKMFRGVERRWVDCLILFFFCINHNVDFIPVLMHRLFSALFALSALVFWPSSSHLDTHCFLRRRHAEAVSCDMHRVCCVAEHDRRLDGR